MFREPFYHYIEASKCPPVPDLPKEQIGSESAKILQALGARSCKTDGSVFQAEIQAQVSSFVADASFGAKTSLAKTAAIGCEQIAAITNKYNKAVQNVACLLNTSTNVTKTDVSGVQNINFEANANNGDLNINCPDGFNINQKMVLKMVSKINLNDQEVAQIANECNDVIKTAVDAAQSSTSGIGATPQGSKAISDTLANINNISQTNKIKETIKEITTSMIGKQTVSFKAKNINISGKNCNISQNMLIEMISEQIVADTVATGLSNLSKAVVETETKLAQKAENKGAEELGLKLPGLPPGMGRYIVIGVILLVLVGGVLFIVNKRSGQALDKLTPGNVDSLISKMPSKRIHF